VQQISLHLRVEEESRVEYRSRTRVVEKEELNEMRREELKLIE
jgi:hypothetical protein